MTDEIEKLRNEITILRREVSDRMYIAETVAKCGFEMSRALVATMKRHGVESAAIVADLADLARHCGGDHNFQNMLGNCVAILIAEVEERVSGSPFGGGAGHA